VITTQTLLATTVYGQASGNYDGSSQDWESDAVTAANYYRGRGGLQTVTFRVSAFLGAMILEGTLDTLTDSAAWFSVYEYGDSSSAVPLTDYHPATITGNFTWLRVRVIGFEGGTIDSVVVAY
jgi:hypothetical protein